MSETQHHSNRGSRWEYSRAKLDELIAERDRVTSDPDWPKNISTADFGRLLNAIDEQRLGLWRRERNRRATQPDPALDVTEPDPHAS